MANLTEAVRVMTAALQAVYDGSRTQGAHSGMSWREVESICADALAATSQVEAATSEAVECKLVPVEPTKPMLQALADNCFSPRSGYAAMLSAVQQDLPTRTVQEKSILSGLNEQEVWDTLVDEFGVEHISGSGDYAKYGIVLWTPKQASQAVAALLALPATAQAKPDLSGLTRYCASTEFGMPCMEEDPRADWVKIAEVEALLAHPVAQAKPEGGE